MGPRGLLVGIAGSATQPTRLPLVEIQDTFEDLPPIEEAARWRRSRRSYSIVAWQVITHPRSSPSYRKLRSPIPEHAAVGLFTHSRWTDEAREQTKAFARALGARAVLLRTPPAFRATPEHEARLENFVALASGPDMTVAWEWAPRSWAPERALGLADRLGIAAAVDPLGGPVPASDPVYVRVTDASTGGRPLDEASAKRIRGEVQGRRGWVVFATAAAEDDALRLADLL
ncbi:MAG: DUF72 domain-containing protein [Acidobacteria bacterium]|nr:DUF72 domain-containing protein [Acidobacteriota bacterium]